MSPIGCEHRNQKGAQAGGKGGGGARRGSVPGNVRGHHSTEHHPAVAEGSGDAAEGSGERQRAAEGGRGQRGTTRLRFQYLCCVPRSSTSTYRPFSRRSVGRGRCVPVFDSC